MNYYGAKQLAQSFRTVRKNTLAIAEEIPEDKYDFKATPDVMSIGEMLAHVAISPLWQIEAHGSKIDRIEFEMFASRLQQAKAAAAALRTKAEIVRALTDDGEKFARFVETLDEDTLQGTVSFPPPVQPSTKTRFEMLLGVKEHEMHHRAQLMTLQRMIGQVPHLTRQMQDRMAQMMASQQPAAQR
jgi:uncharacterized damage-inducible protein DinB